MALKKAADQQWFGVSDPWCQRAIGAFVGPRSIPDAGTRREIQVATTRGVALLRRKTAELRAI